MNTEKRRDVYAGQRPARLRRLARGAADAQADQTPEEEVPRRAQACRDGKKQGGGVKCSSFYDSEEEQVVTAARAETGLLIIELYGYGGETVDDK